MNTTWFVTVALALTGGSALFAGEGIKEVRTGKTLLVRDYGEDRWRLVARPPWNFWINRSVWRVEGETQQWETLPVDHPDFQKLTQAMVAAMGLWENVPTTRINLERVGGGFIDRRRWTIRDERNAVTLISHLDSQGQEVDSGSGNLYVRSSGSAAWVSEDDILEDREHIQRDFHLAVGDLTKKIGHSLGFNYSWLTDDVVRGVTGARSMGSIMSNSSVISRPAQTGVLSIDDVALVSRMYPNHAQRLSRSTGTIRGRLLGERGEKEIYGANVLLIDQRTGQAILSRISGFGTSEPRGSKNGLFEVNGVPPGTYSVLAVDSHEDVQFRGGSDNHRISHVEYDTERETQTWVDAQGKFDGGFPRAWVRDIAIGHGQIVDLGRVIAGVERTFDQPDLFADVNAVYSGTRVYPMFRCIFKSDGQIVHDSNWQLWQFPTPRYTVRLPAKEYSVQIWGLAPQWGWPPYRVDVIQDWTLLDYRPRKATFVWSRATGTFFHKILGLSPDVEAISYFLFLKDSNGGWVVPGSLVGNPASPLDGRCFRTHLPRGSYSFQVMFSVAEGLPWLILKDWTSLVVE